MKNLTFFTENEDLNSIIEFELQDHKILGINKISTGWTNIVLEANTNKDNYIFRFPRNNFFSSKIEKDVEANKFLRNEIGIKTVEMDIRYNNKRPFSIYKKIDGTALTERISFLSNEKLEKITKDIAEFFHKIHSIDINNIPNIFKIRLSDFLIDLSKVDNNNYYYYYDLSSLFELKDDEENNLVFVHGDLNIGNIILDENDEICAFIDFAFTGLSDVYCDLSRISCRVDRDFLEKIINKYEVISNKKIDIEKIDKRNKMWKYIEEQYIIYMKKFFPEIKV